MEECTLITEGTLSSNKSSKDKTAFSNEFFTECANAGDAIKGKVLSAQLTSSGEMKFKSAVTVTIPGPCNYTIKKYSVTFNTHAKEATDGTGEVVAKLSKAGSSPSCSKTDKFAVNAAVTNSTLGLYGTEL